MGDRFYTGVHFVGSLIFMASSRPVILHVERTDRAGPFILAANHHSPYDVPLLIRHSRRKLDFVSIVEIFKHPFVRWFYGSMNAFAIDRSRADSAGVRTILHRLRNGRAVAMFPEGRIRRPPNSVTEGHPFRPGVARLAIMANVPIVPAVVVNSAAYERTTSWLPIRDPVWRNLRQPDCSPRQRHRRRGHVIDRSFPRQRLRDALQGTKTHCSKPISQRCCPGRRPPMRCETRE